MKIISLTLTLLTYNEDDGKKEMVGKIEEHMGIYKVVIELVSIFIIRKNSHA